jgi:hypothetical protein
MGYNIFLVIAYIQSGFKYFNPLIRNIRPFNRLMSSSVFLKTWSRRSPQSTPPFAIDIGFNKHELSDLVEILLNL